jgi:general secretion pathway protein I
MRSQRGFTLIEVLVALMIVAAAIMASASLWSGNFTVMRKSALNYDVATILERKMVEIEAKYKDKPLTEVPDEEEGDFGSDFPQFRWKMKSREMEFPDLGPIIASQNEEPNEMLVSMIKQMTEYLNKAIKEVQVSVFVKRGKREMEFSATQYFVDYTKEFAGAAGEGGTPTPKPDEPK